jgi:hypothetical protein
LTLARTLLQYASSATRVRQFDEAEAAVAEAESLPTLPTAGRLRLYDVKANVSSYLGKQEAAVHAYELLRSEYRSLGNASEEHNMTINLAEIEHERGETGRAIALVRESLPGAREQSDRTLLANLLVNLAGYLLAVDDLDGGFGASREAIEALAESEPESVLVAVATEHRALDLALRGDFRRAATLAGYLDVALARHEYERGFTEATSRERLDALLREYLEPSDRARLFAEGAGLDQQAAVFLAVRKP